MLKSAFFANMCGMVVDIDVTVHENVDVDEVVDFVGDVVAFFVSTVTAASVAAVEVSEMGTELLAVTSLVVPIESSD